jgi:hypothetical protein
MWDKEETQNLMQLGLTFEQAKIAIGRIAEHRQIADLQGYKRGFDSGYNDAQRQYQIGSGGGNTSKGYLVYTPGDRVIWVKE